MKKYIGIDLGTSAVKVLLLREDSVIEGTAEVEYPLSSPAPGFSEQSPADWYDGTLQALRALLSRFGTDGICAISFSGQMHGLVMLDENDAVIRPAILWNDARSTAEVAYLNETVGRETLLAETGNIAFAGFTAPKLLWVKANEPENFARAQKIMLPKDFLAYRLSGVFASDVSDASGTLYFDVQNRRYSKKMLDILGITEEQLPAVYESRTVIGTLLPSLAAELGLSPDTAIVIGAGDNAASAIGTGTVGDGDANISLGTSGTVFVESAAFGYDKDSAIHAFASAAGKYHYLACILSAASAQKWWVKGIAHDDYDREIPEALLGENHVLFLPYLTGERSPIGDENAKSVFWGMTPQTTRDHMMLAVLEGVAFALRQNIDVIRSLGVRLTQSRLCGGGARTKIWRTVLASVLDVTLLIPEMEQGGALGAALLAARGVEDDETYARLTAPLYRTSEVVRPDPILREKYDRLYKAYTKLYPALREVQL